MFLINITTNPINILIFTLKIINLLLLIKNQNQDSVSSKIRLMIIPKSLEIVENIIVVGSRSLDQRKVHMLIKDISSRLMLESV